MTESILTHFVAWLYSTNLASSTVKNYLAAVRHSQISLGMGDPQMGTMPQLEYILKGVKRKAQSSSRTRLPITPGVLMQLKQAWQHSPDTRDAVMLWAAATLCFFGFLRSGEVVSPGDHTFDPTVHLAYGDVTISDPHDPSFLEVRIKASKTDPFRKGVTIVLGRTTDELCPVAAITDYMVRRGAEAGPFFLFADGCFLTRVRFVKAVRSALSRSGFNCALYAGHSFRIGAATTAAQQGFQDSLIKTLGRWESAAYSVYIRTPREVLQNVAQRLVQGSRGDGASASSVQSVVSHTPTTTT